MSRRLPAVLVLALVVVVVALALLAIPAPAPAQAAGAAPSLAPAGSERFPRRAFLLTLPERRPLSTDQLTVVENGDAVRGLELIATGGTARSFGVVLVIDASQSMRGRAIEGAIEAARELARQRNGGQRIGIVVFNRTAKVLLDLTDDQAAIDRALSSAPRLAPQTHVFDAVGTALDMLEQARIAAGTVVVLSDGADTGSRASVEATGRRARDAGVRVFSVGLRSGAFDPGELRRLAAVAGGGRYATAGSVRELSAIFRQIGAQLASEYLIRYRSAARPGRDVRVAIRIDGVAAVATATYRVAGDASFVLVEDSFWTSTLGVALTTILCSLLLAVALAFLLVRRLRGPGVRERIGAFVSGDEPPPQPAAERTEMLTGRVLGSTERSLERTRWWAAFKQDVEIAAIKTEPLHIVALAAGVALLIMWILGQMTGSALPALAVAIAMPVAVRAAVRFKRDRQRRRFAEQLPDMLQGVASALRAGHGLVGGLAMVVDGAQEPSRTEFGRVVADERIGVPLEESLESMRRRMDNRDVQQVALVAELQRESGGNIAEVIDRVTATVRQRAELRRMVRGLTAQGRLSRTVVSALPIALLLIISVINPQYVAPLFNTAGGRIMLLIGAAMLVMGSLVIKKIVDFKV